MSSADKRAQQKIENIEKMLIEIYPNVNSRKAVTRTHIESMVESSRVRKKDGFYMYTIIKGNDSHGILIYKETDHTQTAKFYIYEPNGRRHINDGYQFDVRVIADSPVIELDTRMVPRRAINDHVGHCAVWCIVVIILWNTFEGNDRWVALDIFNNKMMSDFEVRKVFIERVFNLILNSGRVDFTVREQAMDFVQQVRTMLLEIPIAIPE